MLNIMKSREQQFSDITREIIKIRSAFCGKS